MTAITRIPTNTNYLQPTKFLLTIDRIPNTQYFCQTANLPGVSLGKATFNTPRLDFQVAGTKLSYNDFNIKFNIDENIKSWQDLYIWFLSIASPEGSDESNALSNLTSKRTNLKNYSNGTLTILTALNNPSINVRFFNMFPTSLSDIDFDTTSSADNILTATASFRYEYFTFN